MAEESKFFKVIFILIFAGAIVVLGAKELRQKYYPKTGRSKDMRKMLEELHGEGDMDRASISRKGLEKGNTKTSSESDGKVSTAPAVEPKAGKDDLDRGDRRQLKELIDKLMP